MEFPIAKYFANAKKLYHQYFKLREFVFDFDNYDGTETDNNHVISDENVYEYEFINQGDSICLINGLKLYPQFAGIPPFRIKLDNRNREKDVQVYKYSFLPLDYIICNPIHLSQNKDLVTTGIMTTPDDLNFQIDLVSNQMEFDGGGCPIMIQAPPVTKTCSGKICSPWFFRSIIGCHYSIELFIDGVPVNDAFEVINPSTALAIQNQLIASLKFPFKDINVVVTKDGINLCFELSKVVLQKDGAGQLILQIVALGPCPSADIEPVQMVCDLNQRNSLLVISKLPALRTKSNKRLDV